MDEVTRRQSRIAEVSVVVLLGLLVWWPLVLLLVLFVMPVLVLSATAASAVAAVAVPMWLLARRFRGHNHAQHLRLPTKRGRR